MPQIIAPFREFVVLQSGNATGITSAAPFALRNLPANGYNSFLLQIRNLQTTAGITSWNLGVTFFDGTALDVGATDYASVVYGATKTPDGLILNGIANGPVGNADIDVDIRLNSFLDAARKSELISDASIMYGSSNDAANRQNFATTRNANKSHNGLNLTPSANTVSFNWRLIGQRTL